MRSGTGRPTRQILHVDMDAFYASVEARDDPALAGRPVIVGADPKGGRGRGVVATCSYEARRFGVHSAMPISEAYRRCPHGEYLPPRMSHYAAVSKGIFEIFGRFTDCVEPLSLDEAFLDVTASRALFGSGPEIAAQVRRTIREETGLTASVGVAMSKYAAKVASDLEKPDGLTVVPPGQEAEFLAPLGIERLWGAGPAAQARLRELGLYTIGAVARCDRHRLERRLGALGRRFHDLANGRDARPVVPGGRRKSLGHETTFGSDQIDRARVERRLLSLCEETATGLRNRGFAGRTVNIKLRFDGFETITRQRTLDQPVATTERIWPVARDLFREADRSRRRIRLIGVSLTNLERPRDTQLGLFHVTPEGSEATGAVARDETLADAMDQLRSRFGRDSVTRAALLDRGDRT